MSDINSIVNSFVLTNSNRIAGEKKRRLCVVAIGWDTNANKLKAEKAVTKLVKPGLEVLPWWDGGSVRNNKLESVEDFSSMPDCDSYYFLLPAGELVPTMAHEFGTSWAPWYAQEIMGQLIHAGKKVFCNHGDVSPCDLQRQGFMRVDRVAPLAGEWKQAGSLWQFHEKRWTEDELQDSPALFGKCPFWTPEEIADTRSWEVVLTNAAEVLGFDEQRISRMLARYERADRNGKLCMLTNALDAVFDEEDWRENGIQIALGGRDLEPLTFAHARDSYWRDLINRGFLAGVYKQKVRQYCDRVIGWKELQDEQAEVRWMASGLPFHGVPEHGTEISKTSSGYWDAHDTFINTGTEDSVTDSGNPIPRHWVDFSAYLQPWSAGEEAVEEAGRLSLNLTGEEASEEFEDEDGWVPSIEAWQDTHDRLATPRFEKQYAPDCSDEEAWQCLFEVEESLDRVRDLLGRNQTDALETLLADKACETVEDLLAHYRGRIPQTAKALLRGEDNPMRARLKEIADDISWLLANPSGSESEPVDLDVLNILLVERGVDMDERHRILKLATVLAPLC